MILRAIFFSLICFLPQFAFLQNTVEVDLYKVDFEKGFINLYVKALEDGQPAKLTKDQIKLVESFEGKSDTLGVFIIKPDTITFNDTIEQYSILFLVDLGANMDENAVELAKQMIEEVVGALSLNNNTVFYLTAFNDTRLTNRQKFNSSTLKQTLNVLRAEEKSTDFNRVLIEDLRFLKGEEGKKVLFVMGPGQNATKGIEDYQNMLPYDSLDVLRQLKSLPDDFVRFSIGLGNNVNYEVLRPIAKIQGHYAQGRLPDGYEEILDDNVVILSTHFVQIDPKNPVFKGEKRNYTLLIEDQVSQPYSIRLGTPNTPISIKDNTSILSWIFWFLMGLVIVLTVLGVCSVLVPIIQKKNFSNKYVYKYKQEGPVRLNDPVYNEPIENDELVVRKCQQVVPYSTWKDIGGQCPNFPDCMDPKYLGCNGAGAPMEDRFFSRKGLFRQLNWMWYGALGGFIAWVIVAVFNVMDVQGVKNLIAGILPPEKIEIGDMRFSEGNLYRLFLDGLSNELLLGMAFGTGLILMLAYIVEISESRKFQWKKVILRTVAGLFISVFIFIGGFYLQYSGLLSDPYSSGLLTWTIFGLAVGVILSVGSNIVMMRGLLGGFIAAIISYHVFYSISDLFSNFIAAQLISLIVMGAILGLVLVSVISRLENFELEFIAPKGYQSIPISKWLKNNQEIYIGKEPGSYVYIKWPDPSVDPQHAQLMYENGIVYIQPLAETLVNRKIVPLHKKTTLNNKDLIQLGRESTTIIRYKEKRVAKG